MPYIVGKSFKANGRQMESGERVEDATAFGWHNFEKLLSARYLRPLAAEPVSPESRQSESQRGRSR